MVAAVPPPPVPLTPLAPGSTYAAAGDAVFVASARGDRLFVQRAALDGSRPTVVFRGPKAEQEEFPIGASPSLVAFASHLGRGPERLVSGPPGGPFAVRRLERETFIGHLWVSGTTILTQQIRLSLSKPIRFRSVVYEPGAAPRRLRLPWHGQAIDIAGDRVAFTSDRGLGVLNWLTGELLGIEPLTTNDVDVRDDGVVAASTEEGLFRWTPGSDPARLANIDAGQPQWAGARIVIDDGRWLRVVDASGGVRRLAVESATLGAPVVSGDRVVWSANGCLLSVSVDAGTAAAPAAGACPRAEVEVTDRFVELRRGRVPVRLRCVAAPTVGCRGILAVRGARRRFSMAARARKTVTLRFREPPQFGLRLRIVLVEPGGRRFVRQQSLALTDSNY